MKNDFYNKLVCNSPIAFALCKKTNELSDDYDYIYLEVNNAFEKITGLITENIIDKSQSEIDYNIKKDINQFLLSSIKDFLKENDNKELTYKSHNASFKLSIFSLEEDYFAVQITETENDNFDKEKISLIINLNDIVFVIDKSLNFEKVFTENKRYLFLPKEKIIGRNIRDIFEGDFLKELLLVFDKAYKSKEITSIIFKSPYKDDNRWFKAKIIYDKVERLYIVSVNDITDQIKVKEELIQKTEELEKFFSVNLDLLCIADFEGNFIKVNEEWARKLGYSRKFLEKSKFLDFVHPDDMQSTLDEMSNMSNGVQALKFVNRYRCKDGSYKYIEWRSQPEGKRIYAAARDITRRVEEKIDLQKLVDYSEEFLQIFDKEIDYKRLTDEFREMTGAKVAAFNLYEEDSKRFMTKAISADKGIIKKANDLIGASLIDRIWERDVNREKDLRNKIIIRYDSLIDLTKDVMPKMLVSVLIKTFKLGQTLVIKINRNGTLLGDFTFIMPQGKLFLKDNIIEVFTRQLGLAITQKRTDKKLRESKERYQLLSDVTLEGIMIHRRGKVIDINEALCRLLGYKREEALNKTIVDYIHPEDIEGAVSYIQSKTTEPYMVRIIKKSGEVILGEVESRCIVIDDEITRVTAIRDVSQREEFNQEIIKANKRYVALAKHSRTITWEVNRAGMYTYINEAVFDVLGYRAEELINKKHIYDLHPTPESFIIELDKFLLHKKSFTNYVNPAITKAGEVVWLSTNGIPVLDKEGKVIGYKGSDFDVTHKKMLEEAIYNEKERFKTTLLSVGDGVIATDKEGKILIINKVAEELTGWRQEEALGKDFEEVFHIIHEYTRKRCVNPVKKVLATNQIIELANHTLLISKNGLEIPIEDSAAPIKDENGNVSGVVLVFRDFTEKKEKQDKIEFLSYNDQLTGLYNRRYFEEEIQRIDEESNLPITIIMLDVNGLKLTNDAFGHLAGDYVLKKMASIMKEACSAEDTIARIGGDEFVIILPKTNNIRTEEVIRKIAKSVNDEKMEGIVLSASYGWETKFEAEQDIMNIFKRAEDRMYSRKLSESQSMRHNTINVILKTLYEKSQREEKHSQRVSELSAKIGNAMGFNKDEVNELKTAGLMHDIGKIIIPDDTLNKEGKLRIDEWQTIKRHSETGYKILSSVNEFAPLAKYVLQHHERWDGTGYPEGIKGKDIELYARIICIADSYDAMKSDRPYRKGMSKEQAIREIRNNAGKQFDPEIAKVFVEKVLKEKF